MKILFIIIQDILIFVLCILGIAISPVLLLGYFGTMYVECLIKRINEKWPKKTQHPKVDNTLNIDYFSHCGYVPREQTDTRNRTD